MPTNEITSRMRAPRVGESGWIVGSSAQADLSRRRAEAAYTALKRREFETLPLHSDQLVLGT
jgi:hypothetical protein